MTAQMLGRRRVEACERVLALDAVVRQMRRPGGADHERPLCLRAHHHEPDSGMGGEGVQQLRVRFGDLLERQSLGALRQIDEPEAAGHESRPPPSRAPGSEAPRSASASRFGPSATVPSTDRLRVARASDAPAEAWLLACVGQHGADVAPRLVDRGGRVHLTLRERALHDLLERLAIALAERRALCLAVVGEHDQVIRARRLRRRALQPGQLVIVALEHRQRVGLRESPSGGRPRRSRRRSRS